MDNNNYINPNLPSSYLQGALPNSDMVTADNSQPQMDTTKKGNKKMLTMIIVAAFLLISVIGIMFWGSSTSKKEKSTLKAGCGDQVTKIQDLEKQYATIINHLKQGASLDDSEGRGGSTTVLGIEDINFGSEENLEMDNVLGLEDSASIKASRDYIEMLRKALNSVQSIKEKNQEVKDNLDGFLVFGKISGKIDLPTEKTEEFVKNTEPILTYMKDVENLGIKVVGEGYEFGAAIEEAILRGADQVSVQKLDNKLDDLRDLKRDLEMVNTSNIPEDMKKDHSEAIKDFDEDFKIFIELVDAIKARDVYALQKTLISVASRGESSMQTGATEYISFWQENETLRSVSTVREDWEKVKKSLEK